MTDSEVLQLAKHVDSDGSGEIELDELKVLLTPMMSLTFWWNWSPPGICGGAATRCERCRATASSTGGDVKDALVTSSQGVITTIGYSKVILPKTKVFAFMPRA